MLPCVPQVWPRARQRGERPDVRQRGGGTGWSREEAACLLVCSPGGLLAASGSRFADLGSEYLEQI
eukprot:5781488-Prymnesium_polylepis.2